MENVPCELLTAAESREADRFAAQSGISGISLMEAAGKKVADAVCRRYAPRPALALCGPGNNGGDGFVVARLLKERGWRVKAAFIGENPKGDAAETFARWRAAGGEVAPFSLDLLHDARLAVDALFGTGLNKAVAGPAAEAIAALNASRLPVFAVDIPSGVLADSGETPGEAVRAEATVTFFRAKPGLFLLPGKECAGEVMAADIGIPESALPDARILLNMPKLWRESLPKLSLHAHKYLRGHALVSGGSKETTGASRMTALAAARSGAGLVSIACPPDALPVYAASLLSIMTKPAANVGEFSALANDARIRALALGPGNGVNERTRDFVLAALEAGKPCVLDADALTVFADRRETLFSALHEHCVLTPHEGEFTRLFDFQGDKLFRARKAAEQSGAIVLLKGNDTVIAAPDGRATINADAPPRLATAGAGDVLSGVVLGLMTQGMPAYEAACAGVWLSGEAAHRFGFGMIAEDIIAALPLAFGAVSP